MKHHKIQSEQELQKEHAQEQNQQVELEFATPEELLRHDALHTPVPPAIAHRLQRSIENLPRPRSWWRRLFH